MTSSNEGKTKAVGKIIINHSISTTVLWQLACQKALHCDVTLENKVIPSIKFYV